MKKALILLFTSSLFVLSSCSKDFISVDAIVEKNCTGTYLKINDKFSYVCNQEILASYTNGQAINLSYKTLEGCSKAPNSCNLNFSYDGTVEVKEIFNR